MITDPTFWKRWEHHEATTTAEKRAAVRELDKLTNQLAKMGDLFCGSLRLARTLQESILHCLDIES